MTTEIITLREPSGIHDRRRMDVFASIVPHEDKITVKYYQMDYTKCAIDV